MSVKQLFTIRNTLLGGAALSFLALVFLAGGFAHKKCVFPFCQGYYVGTKQAVNDALAEEQAVPEDTVRLVGLDTLTTNLYEVVAQRYQHGPRHEKGDQRMEYIAGRDGGIDNLGDEMLIATGEGALFVADENFSIQRVSAAIPFSREQFEEDVQGVSGFSREWFGVKDILVTEAEAGQYRLFASYHHWDSTRQCHTLRVSGAALQRSQDDLTSGSWTTFFETTPCLDLKEQKHPFAGHEAGGRLVQPEEDELLLTVGYHGHDGVYGENFPQDPSSSIGKTIRIDLENKQSEIYTYGHRNPQGLHIDAEGRIWSTEHGPKGGDELNLIRQGANYGWPEVTYGTDYGVYQWPLSESQGRHDGYVEPVYAWVPSIGISQLISIKESLFEKWKGDLIVGSLNGSKLFRVRVREGRVVYSEPIAVGLRVRDLVETTRGTIVLKTDAGTFVRLRPTEETAGQLVATS